MSTVSIAWQSSGESGLPLGSVVASILLTITDPNNGVTTQSLAPNATSAAATITIVGNYTAVIQPKSAANVSIGNPVSITFALAPPTSVSLVLPTSMTATVTV